MCWYGGDSPLKVKGCFTVAYQWLARVHEVPLACFPLEELPASDLRLLRIPIRSFGSHQQLRSHCLLRNSSLASDSFLRRTTPASHTFPEQTHLPKPTPSEAHQRSPHLFCEDLSPFNGILFCCFGTFSELFSKHFFLLVFKRNIFNQKLSFLRNQIDNISVFQVRPILYKLPSDYKQIFHLLAGLRVCSL